MTFTTWLAIASALCVVAAPSTAGAQAVAYSVRRAAADTVPQGGDKHLFNRRDAVMAGAFAVTTVLLFPLDRQLARTLQNEAAKANDFFEDASAGVEYIASPGAYLIGGSLYLAGQATGSRKLADLGWHGTEAVLLGEGTSMLLKGILGRGRPLVNVEDPSDFRFGHGFADSDWRSFPSGHTTTAFAAASAVTDETTRWWPGSTWVVGPLMYGGATLVGLSRMYHNRHWASDIALGALIGTFSGKKVVLASHANPNNVIDRFMLGGHVAPSKFGTINVGWGTKW
ncbi:MAG TPA: phosphatase PAP2 family protein [Gemmatimonadaceae bacterium]|nr:phosphatase PAP2 family protein [Gemmatimonadaceae bacterium]